LSPSFSPDGNQVAFAWNGSGSGQTQGNFDIYLKLIGGSEPVRLTHDPADEFSPAWSPDGRFIAFLRTLSADRAGVFLIPAIGGRERKLAEIYQGNPFGPHYGPFLAWFPDGKWLAVADTASPGEPDALFLLSVESGEKTRLTSPPQKCNDASPAVSPDGRTLAFNRFAGRNIADLFLVQLAENLIPSGEPSRLTFENRYSAGPAWTPDGRAIVFSSGTSRTPGLWEIAPSGRAGRTAKPEQLSFAGEGASQPVISRQGHLAYAVVALDIDVWKLDLNGGRPAQRPPVDLISSTRIDADARYSPDGKRIVFVSNRSGSFEIWMCNADGSNPVQLTSFASFFYIDSPRWSPDGRMIYFRYNPGGKPGMYVISSEGGRPKTFGS
jgi:Tol biopolymer transport system component